MVSPTPNPAMTASTSDAKQPKRKSTSTHQSPQDSPPDDEKKPPADPNHGKLKLNDKKHQTTLRDSLKLPLRTGNLVHNLEKNTQKDLSTASPPAPKPPPPSSHPKTSARGTDPRDAQLGRGGHGRASGRGRHNTASTSKPKTSTITPGDDLPPLPEHDDEVDSLLSLKAKINKNTLELTQPEANAGNLGPDFEEEKRAMQNQHLSQMLQNGTPTADDDKSVISVSSSTLHDPNDSTEADTHDDTSSSQQTE